MIGKEEGNSWGAIPTTSGSELICQVLMTQGRQFFRLSHFLKAARCYMEVVEKDPGNVEAWLNLGVSLAYGLQPSEAMDAFVIAAELAPEFRTAPFTVAFRMESYGFHHEALALIKELLDRGIFYNEAERQVLRAGLAYLRGDYSGAELHLCSALEWEPENPSLRSARALMIMESGRPDHALQLLQQQCREEPFSLRNRRDIAEAAWRSGELEIAEIACREVLQAQPYNSPMAQLLSKILWRQRRFARASYWWLHAKARQRISLRSHKC
ncbi:MAG: hypothetical protein QM758_22545 [Armatimonas sp.]